MSLSVGVIGAGSMGTAMSQCLALNVDEVLLYARKKEICDEINSNHFNSTYFPNLKLYDNVRAINSYDDLCDVDVIFLCIPSSTMRSIVTELNNVIKNDCILVSTAKGIENETNMRMTEVIEDVIKRPAVALSGPNIASEMVTGQSSATSIACSDEDSLNKVIEVLENRKFKVDSSLDVVGTEYCGIIKNILAISQGICEGLDINYNARFALFTKSYKEVKDIISLLGGDRQTVDNFCGFGDIITASTLPVSRNHTLGVLYGQGMIIDEKSSGVLFEGKNTAIILKKMCEDLDYDCLTVNFVYDVIIGKKNPKLAFAEFWDGL